MLLKIILYCITLMVMASAVSKNTEKWLRKNRRVFKKMVYTEEEIMRLYHEIDNYSTAKLTDFKLFWSKPIDSPSCSWIMQRWNEITRLKRSECSTCCTTLLSAIAPLTVEYSGKWYNVYHPTGGYQILFIGECKTGTSCAYGTCQIEEDYHTWILVEDSSMTYTPQIRFVPVTYSRFCKCVGS